MILWTDDLKRLGFRRKGSRYWRCDDGYELDDATHVSIFVSTVCDRRAARWECYEVSEFHVTFEVPGHNLHFYYHEGPPHEWAAGGHTSTAEINRLGYDATVLKEEANLIAQQLIVAMGGVFEA